MKSMMSIMGLNANAESYIVPNEVREKMKIEKRVETMEKSLKKIHEKTESKYYDQIEYEWWQTNRSMFD